MEQYGLAKGEFSSFPSGHAILSSSVIYILFSLSWIVPALRGR
jgi:membrane-associated phospholipid phosphatase